MKIIYENINLLLNFNIFYNNKKIMIKISLDKIILKELN